MDSVVHFEMPYDDRDRMAKFYESAFGWRMRKLGEDFLRTYLDAEYEAIRWSVGGYRIEGLGAQLFEAIDGSHFAILGLPLLPLLAFLRQRGMLAS